MHPVNRRPLIIGVIAAALITTLVLFIAGLADGSIVLFVGPLNYQDGSAYLADGEVASEQP